eukprot:1935649-Prymnesium_polylepis.1
MEHGDRDSVCFESLYTDPTPLWTRDGSCLTRQGAADCLTGTRTHARFCRTRGHNPGRVWREDLHMAR